MILALAIFTMGAVGLVKALSVIGLATNEASERHEVETHLKSVLNEVCFHPDLEIGRTRLDQRMNAVTFEVVIDEARLTSEEGKELENMFEVEVTAFDPRGESLGQAKRLVYAKLWETP